MVGSIAEGRTALARALERRSRGLNVAVGGALVVVCLVLYYMTRPSWQVFYNHFVWQADGYLDGRVTIDYPVEASAAGPGNAFFNDVEELVDAQGNPTGQARIPFPPLPAVLLLPFVAAWGIATDQGLTSIVLGAVAVGCAFWFLGRLRLDGLTRALMTLFVGGGTALWYAASIGSTWYFAHVIAVALTFLALGVALRADAAWAERPRDLPAPWLDWQQIAAGFLLGLATTSRLTVAFGGAFFVFVGGGGTWFRRGLGAAIGMAVPVGALLIFTWISTGSFFNPVYQVLYEYEVWAYPHLGYNGDWAISDLRYIPQNLGIMLTGLPDFMPACAEGVERTVWNREGCSWVVPRPVGMSVVLATPAYLVALGAIARVRDRRVAGALVATLLIAVVNLMHFSQGWVQFGYRFSNDFMPFLVIVVALGAARPGRRRLGLAVVAALVAVSILIQAWGISWARTLGW